MIAIWLVPLVVFSGERVFQDSLQQALCQDWNTIYDVRKNRVFTTVDREWNIKRGGYVFFGWDNFFNAMMIGLERVVDEKTADRGFALLGIA